MFEVDESLRLSQILCTLLTIISKTEYSFDGNDYNHVIKDFPLFSVRTVCRLRVVNASV